MSSESLVAVVAGITVAVPLHDVEEVVECGWVTLLPRLPAAMPGVIEWRDLAIPAIDLGAVHGGTPRHDRRHAVVATAGAYTVALLIDSIDGIEETDRIAEDVHRIDAHALLEALTP